MKKFLLLAVTALACVGAAFAQDNQRVVKGYVIDKDGNPISGAEVSATNGAETTLTDADGSFSLQVPLFLKSITATYTGMGSKKLKLNKQGDFIFTLKPKEKHWFLNAVGLVSTGGGLTGAGGGLMFGQLNKWGWYGKATLDSQTCLNVTAGVIKSFSSKWYGYLGLGLGMVCDEDYYSNYWTTYNYATDTFEPHYEGWYETLLYGGMAFEAGVIFKMTKHFNMSLGYTFATDFDWSTRSTFNLGVGYVF